MQEHNDRRRGSIGIVIKSVVFHFGRFIYRKGEFDVLPPRVKVVY